MDAAALAQFEARAAQAEQRLAVLEAKLAGGSGSGAVDTSRYVAELQSLKGVLLAAAAEQEALEKRVAELESENSKLRYQCLHLKRAVTESDEKLAALQAGK
ncbi:MICAL C-terminal [Chlorella sorokiniana]|uniref:MICAL C-terminal n=1 Tax=Chlorella sorokiniana TaxID=3076 RepID=A0A2P6TNK3_CHLSO|nr:MICAL C-terminal [Chlorella sorokiniana]|eukprot:PRW50917.1 MICAL C-terminal [Chlorella sorokiniana]